MYFVSFKTKAIRFPPFTKIQRNIACISFLKKILMYVSFIKPGGSRAYVLSYKSRHGISSYSNWNKNMLLQREVDPFSLSHIHLIQYLSSRHNVRSGFTVVRLG